MSVCANCGTPLPSESAACPNCATASLGTLQTAHDVPQISGYDVLKRVGEGGMGSVYLAQERALNRRVAIKLISGKLSTDAESRARFLREARSMATIEHANVIRVYAFGEVESMPYLAMEFIDGETLADRIRRAGRLTVEDSVRFMRQILLALEAAWEKGIVHRDIKPSNILMDRRDQVHVADFGLAKPSSLADDPVLTHSGHILGTPYYLSPEQASGLPTDFRSDIYSCGILFYEMLTGERPFEGTTPFAIVAKQLHEPLPSIKKKRADVPSRVAKIIDVMTDKRPERRPQSYAELIGMFDALLGITPSQPVIATQTLATSGPIRLDPQNLRRLAIGGAVVLVAIVAAWSMFVTNRNKAAQQTRAAEDKRLAVAIAPFYGPDEDSAKEGRVMAALIERSIAEKVGAANVRIAGVDQTKTPVRSHEDARALGEKLGASVVVWGEAYALRKETEIQPYFTFIPRKPEPVRKAEEMTLNKVSMTAGETPRDMDSAIGGFSEQRTAAVKVQAEAPNQIEMRKMSAEGVGEVVSFLAAVGAFYNRNDSTLALKFLEQAPHTAEALRLRGRVMNDIAHSEDKGFKGALPKKAVKAWNEAATAFQQSLAIDPNDVQTRADLAETYLLLGRFKEAAAEYAKVAAANKPYVTHYAIPFGGLLYIRDAYRSEWSGDGKWDDTGYVLAMNPAEEVVVHRWKMPGVIRAFRPQERGFQLDYGDRVESPETRSIRFVDGRWDRPLTIGGNLLLRMRGMKSGWVLPQNFEAEFIGIIDDQPPRPRLRLRKDVLAGVPKTLPELEAALRDAARRDPTQPWHPFYIGQVLWEEGRTGEAEAVWREMLTRDFGVIWIDWTQMSKACLRLGQPHWADQFFARALAERKKLPQPVQATTLIERLVNAPVMRLHAEQKKDPEVAYKWFVRARELTGPAEGDNYYAAAWAAHFRRIGDSARAAREAAYWRLTNRDPFSFTSETIKLDYAGDAFLALWFAFTTGFLFVLRRAYNRIRDQQPYGVSRAQRWVLGAVAIVACAMVGAVAGFGVASIKGPAMTGVIGVILLAIATGIAAPRVFAGASVIAAVRRIERWLLLASFVTMLAGSAIFVHTANPCASLMTLPIGLSDSLGHPAIVANLETRVEHHKDPRLLYTAAVANQLGGNTQRARQLYEMVSGDPRANQAAAALARGENYLAFPTQQEIYGAFTAGNESWFVFNKATMENIPLAPVLAGMIYSGAAVGLLFFILCAAIRPAGIDDVDRPVGRGWRSRLALAGFAAVPGSFDLVRRSVARGLIELTLLGFTLVSLFTFYITKRVTNPPQDLGVGSWLVPGMNLGNAAPFPPDTTALDLFLAPPYALTFWIASIVVLVALTVLHAARLREIFATMRQDSPSEMPVPPKQQLA